MTESQNEHEKSKDATHPEQDRFVIRGTRYLGFFLAVCAAIGIVYGVFITYVLPNFFLFSSIVWLLFTFWGTAIGFEGRDNHGRSRAPWRFTCTVAALISMSVWVLSIVQHEVDQVPLNLTGIWRSDTQQEEHEIRQDERDQIEREQEEKRSSLLKYQAAWLWLASCGLWSVTLVHAINNTQHHLVNALLVARLNEFRKKDDDESDWLEGMLREIDGNPRGPWGW